MTRMTRLPLGTVTTAVASGVQQITFGIFSRIILEFLMLGRLGLLLAVWRLPLEHRGKDLIRAEAGQVDCEATEAGELSRDHLPCVILQTEAVQTLVS